MKFPPLLTLFSGHHSPIDPSSTQPHPTMIPIFSPLSCFHLQFSTNFHHNENNKQGLIPLQSSTCMDANTIRYISKNQYIFTGYAMLSLSIEVGLHLKCIICIKWKRFKIGIAFISYSHRHISTNHTYDHFNSLPWHSSSMFENKSWQCLPWSPLENQQALIAFSPMFYLIRLKRGTSLPTPGCCVCCRWGNWKPSVWKLFLVPPNNQHHHLCGKSTIRCLIRTAGETFDLSLVSLSLAFFMPRQSLWFWDH